jgi:hypothetical protein
LDDAQVAQNAAVMELGEFFRKWKGRMPLDDFAEMSAEVLVVVEAYLTITRKMLERRAAADAD